MINHAYRLVSPRQFEVAYKDRSLKSDEDFVVIRPTHLSICAADQRYYTGSRGKEALAKKLPMALVHEGIGKVVYDPKAEFEVGTPVVMVPNIPVEKDEVIRENYLHSSKFRSSGYDGFMQDYLFMGRDRIVELPENINPHVAAFIELMTITTHVLTRFNERSHKRRQVFGVWGDGNLGYITSLFLKKVYKDSKVYIFGKTGYKLDNFSFADEVYMIDDIPVDLHIDHAFECVGGIGSQYAIDQIIDHLHPEGSISLMGVSEFSVEINTRMVLEKGITLIGSSRSGRMDFINTVDFLKRNPEVVDYLGTLVGEVHEVKTISDILTAFEKDLTSSWGKSIIEWKI